MKTIRYNTFETNSSSMHSLCISNDWADINNKEISFKMKDFSDRDLVIHTDPESKLSYVWMVFCSGIKFKNSKRALDYLEKNDFYKKHYRYYGWQDDQKVIDEGKDYYSKNLVDVDKSYTDDELIQIENQFKRIISVFDKISALLKEDYNIKLDFSDLKYEVHTDYGCTNLSSVSEKYPSCGCYGNDAVAGYFEMSPTWKALNDFIQSGNPITELDMSAIIHTFNEMLHFAFNEDSCFIQNTDECDNSDKKKHQKTVLEYVKKSKGDMTVLWPIGG